MTKKFFIMQKQLLLILALLFLFVIATSDADFTVRVVYFQPTDAPAAAPVEKIRSAMEHTQKYYADEMEKHKFGRKTFRLERDNTGEIVIHTVKGRHKAQHYFNDTQGTLNAELPVNMKNKNDILLSFIGGLQGVAGGWNGQGQAWFGHDCGACRGWTAIANKNGNFALSTVKHELGHAFGLYHNLRGKRGENFLMWFDGVLQDYEARWLDKSRYFNTGNHIARPPPRILNPKRPEPIQRDNKDYVRFSADINAGQGLYQTQIFRDSDNTVLDWTRLDGQSDTAIFEINRAELTGESRVWIHVQDNDGNQSLIPVDFTLPAKSGTLIAEPIETDRTAIYLTLNYDSPDALTPTNTRWEWSGWEGISFWEQTPDGKLGAKPWGAVEIETHIPYYEQWNYFFYLHALSEIVYDLGGGDYEKFESKFFMPNPCGNVASVEAIFFADGTEIYKTGVLRGSNSQNITISFDIPRDTKEFAIKVTEAGDGPGCDHFIFADAKLTHTSNTISTEGETGGEREIKKHADVNRDGRVTIADLIIVASRYGESVKSDIDPNPDVNRDGIVDIKDITLITDEMPLNAPSINAFPMTNQPVQTQLLNNFPNPFNPETWIPYQLAKDSNVTITIYDTQGVSVCRFPIGFQSAGYYTSKSQAAYWDGHNALGERVASGVYFYQLEADNISLIRKMFILK